MKACYKYWIFILVVINTQFVYSQWVQTNGPSTGAACFTKNGSNIFAGTFGRGVYLSTNKGESWTQVGLTQYDVICLGFCGINLFAGTSNFGLYLSTNNGIDWTSVNDGLLPRIYAIAVIGTNIFVATSFVNAPSSGVYLSTNNGTNWTKVSSGLNGEVYSLGISGDNLFAGTSAGVFLTTDNGTNWTDKSNGLFDEKYEVSSEVFSLAVSGINIFAGTSADTYHSGGVFLSTNNGTNWSSSGLGGNYIHSLITSESNIFASSDSGVFISTNNGTGWNWVWRRPLSDFALPVEMTSFTASVGKGNVLLKWSTASELNNIGFDVERSVNKSDWGKVGFVKGNGNSTLPINYSYVDKSVSKGGKYFYRLKQVDNNGSYKYSNVAEVEFVAPSTFALNQNYPNPFNPSTMISYRLKDKGFVKLKVYGIRGDLVKVLVNETKDAGYYESEFDGKGLASGVYIYRMEVIGDGNKVVYSDIKKTVLLK